MGRTRKSSSESPSKSPSKSQRKEKQKALSDDPPPAPLTPLEQAAAKVDKRIDLLVAQAEKTGGDLDHLLETDPVLKKLEVILDALKPRAPSPEVAKVTANLAGLSVKDPREIANSLGPPSSLARNAGHVNIKATKKTAVFQHHREPNYLEGWNHATLYSPALSYVVDWMRKGVFEETDLLFAFTMASEMSKAFSKERERRDAFNKLLAKHLGSDVTPRPISRSNEDDVTTDGSLVLRFDEHVVLLLQTEHKVERGHGGSPEAENLAYYLYFIVGQPEVYDKTCCPVIFLELEGNLLTMSVGAFEGRMIMKDTVVSTLLEISTADKWLMEQQAAIWHAVRMGVAKLKAEYEQLLTSRPGEKIQPHLPYITKVGNVEFVLENYLWKQKRLVFLAHDKIDTTKKYVVKFTNKSHPQELHKILAGKGFAPTLHGCEPLPPWWYVTVVDYIQEGEHFDPKKTEHAVLDPKLEEAVKLMHDNGWVHGDLRSPNILVKGNQVYIIDLDWAGKPDEQSPPRYPPLLNSDAFNKECQKKGIKAGEPITKEHDLFMLARLKPADAN